ncbi:MAG: hypothetical protein ACMXYG_07125 [Candidatus Woesearchaeota archaeon]
MVRLKKKGYSEQDVFLAVSIAVIVLLVLIIFAMNFSTWFGRKSNDETCRMSVVLNSEVRTANIMGRWGNKDERVSINCPSKSDLEISTSEMRKITRTSSPGAIKYAIMSTFADEMRTCHYRWAGDMNDLSPFAEQKGGIFCGICRKISFSDDIQRMDFAGYDIFGNLNPNSINHFSLYLYNTKMPNSNMYYSEFFTGEKRQSLGSVNSIGEVLNVNDDSFDKLDFLIDTTETYYVTHIVVKGENYITNFLSNYYDLDSLSSDAADCAKYSAIAGSAIFLSVLFIPKVNVIAAAGLAGTMAVTGGAGCIGYLVTKTYRNMDMPIIRQTILMTPDQILQSQCVPYGLSREEIS